MACQVNNLFIGCLMNYLLIANLMNSQQSPSAWENSNKQPQTGQPGPSDYRTAEGGCSLDWKSVLDSLLEHGQEPWGGHLPRTYSLLNCPKTYIHPDLWSLPSPTLPHPCSLIYIFPELPSFEVNTTPCHTKPSCIAFAYIMRGPVLFCYGVNPSCTSRRKQQSSLDSGLPEGRSCIILVCP